MNAIENIFGPTTQVDPATKGKQELGQDDFLKLLVAQLKNQDPNNPADNGEFLGQIAQFSMVSGIDDLGVSFDSVAGSLYSSKAIQAAELVGKQVLVDTNIGSLVEGENMDGVVNLTDPAHNFSVQVLDSSGTLVRSIDLGSVPAGAYKFSWDGLDESGEQAAAGEYVVQTEGLVNGQLEALPVQVYNRVNSVSVDRESTSVLLHLDNNENIGMSAVTQYR